MCVYVYIYMLIWYQLYPLSLVDTCWNPPALVEASKLEQGLPLALASCSCCRRDDSAFCRFWHSLNSLPSLFPSDSDCWGTQAVGLCHAAALRPSIHTFAELCQLWDGPWIPCVHRPIGSSSESAWGSGPSSGLRRQLQCSYGSGIWMLDTRARWVSINPWSGLWRLGNPDVHPFSISDFGFPYWFHNLIILHNTS